MTEYEVCRNEGAIQQIRICGGDEYACKCNQSRKC